MARVPADATAFAHRDAAVLAVVVSFYEGPDDWPVRREWVDRLVRAIDQGAPGAYSNFLAEEGEERVRAAYPGATWERLAAIKKQYDPTNLFHLNQNVPPA
jgi:FAD/FMN-containing dehydrogenase